MKLFDIDGQISLFDESLFSIHTAKNETRELKKFEAWETVDGEVYIAIDNNDTLCVKGFGLTQEKKCSNQTVAEALFNDMKLKFITQACINAIIGKKGFKRLDVCSLSA